MTVTGLLAVTDQSQSEVTGASHHHTITLSHCHNDQKDNISLAIIVFSLSEAHRHTASLHSGGLMNLKMYFETHQPGQIDIIHAPNTDIQSCLEWYPISNTCLYKGPNIWLCNSLSFVRSTCFRAFSDKTKQPLFAEISILLHRPQGTRLRILDVDCDVKLIKLMECFKLSRGKTGNLLQIPRLLCSTLVKLYRHIKPIWFTGGKTFQR